MIKIELLNTVILQGLALRNAHMITLRKRIKSQSIFYTTFRSQETYGEYFNIIYKLKEFVGSQIDFLITNKILNWEAANAFVL